MSNQVSNYRGRQRQAPADAMDRSIPGHIRCSAGSPHQCLALGAEWLTSQPSGSLSELANRGCLPTLQDLSGALPDLAVMEQGGGAVHCRTAPSATRLCLDGPPGAVVPPGLRAELINRHPGRSLGKERSRLLAAQFPQSRRQVKNALRIAVRSAFR